MNSKKCCYFQSHARWFKMIITFFLFYYTAKSGRMKRDLMRFECLVEHDEEGAFNHEMELTIRGNAEKMSTQKHNKKEEISHPR